MKTSVEDAMRWAREYSDIIKHEANSKGEISPKIYRAADTLADEVERLQALNEHIEKHHERYHLGPCLVSSSSSCWYLVDVRSAAMFGRFETEDELREVLGENEAEYETGVRYLQVWEMKNGEFVRSADPEEWLQEEGSND